MAGVDQQALEAAGAQQAAIDLLGAELAAARDVVRAAAERLEVEQGRAPTPDHQSQRLVELAGAGGGRAVGLAHQRLKGGEIEIARRHAVAVMIDQGQVDGDFAGHG